MSVRWWRPGPGEVCCSSPRSAQLSCSFSPLALQIWRFWIMCSTACWVQCTPTAAMLLCYMSRSGWPLVLLFTTLRCPSSCVLMNINVSLSGPYREESKPSYLAFTTSSAKHTPPLQVCYFCWFTFVLSHNLGWYSCGTVRGEIWFHSVCCIIFSENTCGAHWENLYPMNMDFTFIFLIVFREKCLHPAYSVCCNFICCYWHLFGLSWLMHKMSVKLRITWDNFSSILSLLFGYFWRTCLWCFSLPEIFSAERKVSGDVVSSFACVYVLCSSLVYFQIARLC